MVIKFLVEIFRVISLISFRVRDITEWRDKLDQCLRDLNLEITVQKDAKEACERALEAKVGFIPEGICPEGC